MTADVSRLFFQLLRSPGARRDVATHLRALLGSDDLKWRHHGIGVLQAYLREDPTGEYELRLHVWHDALVRPGIQQSGDCHDHRFDLFSHVFCGHVLETVYNTEPDEARAATPMDIWDVENARSAASRGDTGNFDGACTKSGSTFATKYDRLHTDGDTYRLPRGVFHRTRILSPVAVTICEMTRKAGQARILTPQGMEPVHAFTPNPGYQADALRVEVLKQARIKLAAIAANQ